MVFEYAKKFAGGVKEKARDVKHRLGYGEKDDITEINDRTENISKYESKINNDLSEINRRFESKRKRAEQRLSEVDKHPALNQYGIQDNTVKVGGGNSFYERLFNDGAETIQLESKTLLDYVDELNHEIEIRENEMDRCINSLEQVEGYTIGEVAGIESDLDEYTENTLKSVRADSIFAERGEKLNDEIDALQQELVSTVDKYTEKLYNEAVDMADDLGGMNRSEEGEFDILRSLADSRSSVMDRSRGSGSLGSSKVLDESKRALEAQSGLVNEYMNELESYQDDIETLYRKAAGSVDNHQLKPVEERLDAIDKGLDGLSEVVDGEEHPTVDDALENTVRRGLGGSRKNSYREPRARAGGI